MVYVSWIFCVDGYSRSRQFHLFSVSSLQSFLLNIISTPTRLTNISQLSDSLNHTGHYTEVHYNYHISTEPWSLLSSTIGVNLKKAFWLCQSISHRTWAFIIDYESVAPVNLLLELVTIKTRKVLVAVWIISDLEQTLWEAARKCWTGRRCCAVVNS
jgi:hypothetical protein